MYLYTQKYVCKWGDQLHTWCVRMKFSKLNSLWQKKSSFRGEKEAATVNTRLSAFPCKSWRATITIQTRGNCQPSSHRDECFNLKISPGSFPTSNTSLYQCPPLFIMPSFINKLPEATGYQSSSEQNPVTSLSYRITVKFRSNTRGPQPSDKIDVRISS